MQKKKSRRILSPAIALLACILQAWISVMAQTPAKKPEPQSTPPQGMGGVSTGAPVNYNSPRTVGIVDPKAPVIFELMTDKTELANFIHKTGGDAKDYILYDVSGGVPAIGHDGAGLADIY